MNHYKDFYKKLGENLQKIQDKSNLSNGALATLLDVSEKDLLAYKQGIIPITPEIFRKLKASLYSSRDKNFMNDVFEGIEVLSESLNVTLLEKSVIHNLRQMNDDMDRFIIDVISMQHAAQSS